MQFLGLYEFIGFALVLQLVFAAHPLSNGPGFESTSNIFKGFKTEPSIIADDFHVQRITKDRSILSDGYIFMDSMVKAYKYGFGVSIYTEDGELVYRGHREKRAQNFHVCDFVGVKGAHLCYYTRWTSHRTPNLPEGDLGSPKTTFGRLIILDQSYKEVMIIKHGFDELSVNGHAFETHDDGYSATTVVGRPRAVDLRKHGGPKLGWIQNQCIQDFDLPSGEDAFHWCYYESGLSIWQSKYIFYMGKPGVKHPWDFLHTNAVDKNKHGDYIASIRHADVLIKIAGKRNPDGAKPGTVLWRLGGKSNDFKMRNFDTHQGFTRQHDVKYISTNGTHEVLSVFNNAWDWYFGPSQKYSEGQIISVDTKKMIAKREHVYPHPRRSKGRSKSLSSGRGGVQLLPNSNVMVGWGVLPEFTEFSANGTVLLHVKYKRDVPTKGREFSYRVTRSPWIGTPSWDPKLVAYSPNCGSKTPLFAYASYNGATQVRSWRFSGAQAKNGTWTRLGTFPKKGFETKVNLDKIWDFIPFILAEALDAQGLVLGSVTSRVFVPAKKFKSLCHHDGCRRGFHYPHKANRAKSCEKPPNTSSLVHSGTAKPPSNATAALLPFPSKISSLTFTSSSTLSVSSSISSSSKVSEGPAPSTARISSVSNHGSTTVNPKSTTPPSKANTPSPTLAASKQHDNTTNSDTPQPPLIISFIALAALISLNEVLVGAMHILLVGGFDPAWNYLSIPSDSSQS